MEMEKMMIPTCTYLFTSHGIIAPCITFSKHILRLGYGLACRGVPRVVVVDLGESTASRGLKLAVVRGDSGIDQSRIVSEAGRHAFASIL